MFFINAEGWALTCGHVADQIAFGGQIREKYMSFKKDLLTLRGKKKDRQIRRELEQKYSYSKDITAELLVSFVNCIEGPLNLRITRHPNIDLALLKFNDFTRLLCNKFPVFPSDTSGLKQGKSLCRLGFPFPEFNNYQYDTASDEISWTTQGRVDSPRFPIEGMVTRHLVGPKGEILGFEMSTPGLKGQSGGPAFDIEGRVWGIQSATNHLDLDFDVDQEVIRGGHTKRVKDSAFLHVGHCVHVEIVKTFMKENNVQFQEG